jgi:hypothetical protein
MCNGYIHPNILYFGTSQLHIPAALPHLGRTSGTHWIGGWLLAVPRLGLDAVKKRKILTILGLELRPLVRPARSQSLYRLRCLDSPSLTSAFLIVYHLMIISEVETYRGL